MIRLLAVSSRQSYTPGRNRTGRAEVRPSREKSEQERRQRVAEHGHYYDRKSLRSEPRTKEACPLKSSRPGVIGCEDTFLPSHARSTQQGALKQPCLAHRKTSMDTYRHGHDRLSARSCKLHIRPNQGRGIDGCCGVPNDDQLVLPSLLLLRRIFRRVLPPMTADVSIPLTGVHVL